MVAMIPAVCVGEVVVEMVLGGGVGAEEVEEAAVEGAIEGVDDVGRIGQFLWPLQSVGCSHHESIDVHN